MKVTRLMALPGDGGSGSVLRIFRHQSAAGASLRGRRRLLKRTEIANLIVKYEMTGLSLSGSLFSGTKFVPRYMLNLEAPIPEIN